MKNTLAENMRRFGTKNLTEQTEPPMATPLPIEQQGLYLWVTEWAVPRGFKLFQHKTLTRIWKLNTLRGEVYIEILNTLRGEVYIEMRILPTGVIGNMSIDVYRSGVSRAEDSLYTVTITPEEFTKERMAAIQRQLEPYVKR